MRRSHLVLALVLLLGLPACKTNWVKLPVASQRTVMDSDGDWGGIGCFGSEPFVSKPSIPEGEVRAGYVYKNEEGSGIAPCSWWANYVMRGAIKFTLPPGGPGEGGILDGKLRYRAAGASGKPPCQPVRVAIATQPWSVEDDFDITETAEIFNENIPLGEGVQVIKVPAGVLTKWFTGQQPNYGYVFLGPNENFGHNETKSCTTILSDFELEILRAKKK